MANLSYLDLAKYADGAERNPYQERVGMIPLLRWARGNRLLIRAAGSIARSEQATPQHIARPEVMDAEKLICVLVGCVCVVAMTLLCTAYTRRRLPEIWWLGGALLLASLFASYAARAELRLWYPYDLPHFALFGLATWALLEERWELFFLFFLLDMPIRETSIYLAVLGGALAWRQRKWPLLGAVVGFVLVLWLPFRLAVTHHYAHNASEVGVRWRAIEHAVLDPLHWPQLASAGGFLFVPVLLGWRYLADEQRTLVIAAAPCIAVTLAFGMWYESRIFGEWTVLTVLLLCDAFGRWLRAYRESGGINGAMVAAD